MTPTTRRRSSGISLDPDELRYASAPAASVDPGKKESPGRKKQAEPEPAAVRPAARKTAAEVRAIEVPDALEGEAYAGEEKVKIGTTLPLHLKGQVDGAVRFAQDAGGIDGIQTITDFIRVACIRLVTDMQAQHNDGNDFRVPGINRRGRMPGR